jgi:hypothetical protein
MNLYSKLIDQESRRHREVLDRIHRMQSTIVSAERICKRLYLIGLQAEVKAADNAIPYLLLPMAIDLLPELDGALAEAGQKLGRQIVANGRCKYMILPSEADEAGLEIVVSEI